MDRKFTGLMLTRWVSLFLILFLPVSARGSDPMAFQRSAINLAAPGTKISLRHDLDGDGRRDLVVLSGQRLLLFFQSVGGSFPAQPTHSLAIPSAYPMVSLARLDNGKPSRVLFFGPGGLARWDPAEALAADRPEQLSLVLERPFDITTGTAPLLLELAVDLDGDNRDEILVPFQDQLEILSQDDQGQLLLRDALNIPIRTARTAGILPAVQGLGARYFESARLQSQPMIRAVQSSPDGVNFLQASVTSAFPRSLFLDWNGDRKTDVVTEGMVWMQQGNGQFSSQRIPGALRIEWAESALQNQLRVMANLADFNGDGRLDTFRVDSVDNRLSPRTELSVFLARPDRTFSNRPDAVLRTRDISLSSSPALGDMDGDGAPDVALPHLDLQASSASSQFRTFLKEGIQGDLRFYCFDRARSRFPDAPTAMVPLKVNYEMFGAAQLFRPLYAFHWDLNGDGAPDLIVKNSASSLAVHRNLGGRRGFSPGPIQTLSVAPMHISDLDLHDLNGDGIGDVVATVYQPNAPKRLILAIFVSRPAGTTP